MLCPRQYFIENHAKFGLQFELLLSIMVQSLPLREMSQNLDISQGYCDKYLKYIQQIATILGCVRMTPIKVSLTTTEIAKKY